MPWVPREAGDHTDRCLQKSFPSLCVTLWPHHMGNAAVSRSPAQNPLLNPLPALILRSLPVPGTGRAEYSGRNLFPSPMPKPVKVLSGPLGRGDSC